MMAIARQRFPADWPSNVRAGSDGVHHDHHDLLDLREGLPQQLAEQRHPGQGGSSPGATPSQRLRLVLWG